MQTTASTNDALRTLSANEIDAIAGGAAHIVHISLPFGYRLSLASVTGDAGTTFHAGLRDGDGNKIGSITGAIP